MSSRLTSQPTDFKDWTFKDLKEILNQEPNGAQKLDSILRVKFSTEEKFWFAQASFTLMDEMKSNRISDLFELDLKIMDAIKKQKSKGIDGIITDPLNIQLRFYIEIPVVMEFVNKGIGEERTKILTNYIEEFKAGSDYQNYKDLVFGYTIQMVIDIQTSIIKEHKNKK